VSSLRLDHVTILTDRIDETVAFYGDVLNLQPGYRPKLMRDGVESPGVWLYAAGGDYPILHIIDRPPEGRPTGAFDHFAFRSERLLPFLDHLRSRGLQFRAVPVADTADTQVHFHDPNGVKIEVIFAERVDPAALS
jgi:catechol 2,3-dioxygenase-like lactoylglutathione lyase family enzyme